jgi:S-adenosylmethionine-diacylglycerol 3-amino-3-carboxypropyl transferase
VLPLVHSRDTVAALLRPLPKDVRGRFYSERWDGLRWRLLFRTFFSRAVMGRLGRDPECFRYADGPVAERILARAKHAIAELDPSTNPYLHWIVTGTHGQVLPCALRAENFDIIRRNLDRLTIRSGSVESLLERAGDRTVDRFNLSDMFEYVPPGHYDRSLRGIVRVSRPGARLVYWNLLALRRRPEALADRVVPLDALAARLHDADRAFFYRALRIEEVQ